MPRDYKLQLDDIIEAVARIREYTEGLTEEAFVSDRKTQDAVIRNMEIIGEAVGSLPDDIKASRGEIEWRKIVAFRNILIHEYFGVNVRILWDVITSKLDELEKCCRELL